MVADGSKPLSGQANAWAFGSRPTKAEIASKKAVAHQIGTPDAFMASLPHQSRQRELQMLLSTLLTEEGEKSRDCRPQVFLSYHFLAARHRLNTLSDESEDERNAGQEPKRLRSASTTPRRLGAPRLRHRQCYGNRSR